MNNYGNILLYRPDNIGDVVLFSGAIQHIRKLYPDSHITLAVTQQVINLVELCPHVNDIISTDSLVFWKKLEKSVFFKIKLFRLLIKFLERTKNRILPKFDTVIYPVKSPQTTHLETIYYLSPRHCFGITGCNANEPPCGFPLHLKPETLFSRYLDVTDLDPWQHELQTSANFLEFLGCTISSDDVIKPVVWLSEPDKIYSSSIMPKVARPIIGLFPGASVSFKKWHPYNYEKLADLIKKNVVFVVLGGPGDVELTTEVAARLARFQPPENVINIAGMTSLRQLYGCLQLCSALVSMDTAALHLGITSGIPTIGLVGGGHFGRFVPWGDPVKNRIVTHTMDCFNCNWKCSFQSTRCIEGIEVTEVVNVVTELIH